MLACRAPFAAGPSLVPEPFQAEVVGVQILAPLPYIIALWEFDHPVTVTHPLVLQLELEFGEGYLQPSAVTQEDPGAVRAVYGTPGEGFVYPWRINADPTNLRFWGGSCLVPQSGTTHD